MQWRVRAPRGHAGAEAAAAGDVEVDTLGCSAWAACGGMALMVGVMLCATSPLTWLLVAGPGLLLWGKLGLGTTLVVFWAATRRVGHHRQGPALGRRFPSPLWSATLQVVAMLFILVAINIWVHHHPWSRDLTQGNIYTLSDQTTRVLASLPTDVSIDAFYANVERDFGAVEEMLNRYHDSCHKVHVAMVDPEARPDLVQRYHITDRGPRIVVHAAQAAPIYIRDLSEEALTQALLGAGTAHNKKVYLLVGHGERSPHDAALAEGGKRFAEVVAAEGYATAPLDLCQAATPPVGPHTSVAMNAVRDVACAVPQDATVVVASGIVHPLLPPEVLALQVFVARGGRLLLLLEPHFKTGLEPLCRAFRIGLRDDVIVDPSPLGRLLALGPATAMVQAVRSDHPIVRKPPAGVIMPTARSLEILGPNPSEADEVEVVPLAHATETAWGETHMDAQGIAHKDAEDHAPPLFVALAAERHGESPGATLPARLVVLGDSDCISNKYLGLQGNRDFALNAVHWLAAQEDQISIRPKGRTSSRLYLSGGQMNIIKYVTMDILPVLIIATGLGIQFVRKQR